MINVFWHSLLIGILCALPTFQGYFRVLEMKRRDTDLKKMEVYAMVESAYISSGLSTFFWVFLISFAIWSI